MLAATLPQPLSDAAVLLLGDRLLVAGGSAASGTVASVGELVTGVLIVGAPLGRPDVSDNAGKLDLGQRVADRCLARELNQRSAADPVAEQIAALFVLGLLPTGEWHAPQSCANTAAASRDGVPGAELPHPA